jgi:hypothetical protein
MVNGEWPMSGSLAEAGRPDGPKQRSLVRIATISAFFLLEPSLPTPGPVAGH